MIMNKFVLPLLGLFFLFGTVTAYQINIDAPDTLSVGKPLIVTGTTNFGIGTPLDVVLFQQITANTEIQRKTVYVQSDNTFRAVFDTTNLTKGKYKVEVPASGLGDSHNMQLVEIIDRTDEITLISGLSQEYTGTLLIAGTMKDNHNAGIQIKVTGPDGEKIFCPQYIATYNQGRFSTEVSITKGGAYDISFTDSEGFVGTRRITVTGGERITVTPTLITPVTTSLSVLSARATASRDSPAYFEVKAGYGPVKVYTSSRIDWVLEFIDEKGILQTVNENGELNREEIEIQGRGKSVFFRIYPYKYSDNGAIILYAENAQSIRVSQTLPDAFKGLSGNPVVPEETEASLGSVIACSALVLAVALLHRHR